MYVVRAFICGSCVEIISEVFFCVFRLYDVFAETINRGSDTSMLFCIFFMSYKSSVTKYGFKFLSKSLIQNGH